MTKFVENTGQPLEGLSLSLCILDILNNTVSKEQVTSIITGFNVAKTEGDFIENTLDHYAEIYWREDPEKGKSLALEFYRAGKISMSEVNNNAVGQGIWKNPNPTESFNIV